MTPTPTTIAITDTDTGTTKTGTEPAQNGTVGNRSKIPAGLLSGGKSSNLAVPIGYQPINSHHSNTDDVTSSASSSRAPSPLGHPTTTSSPTSNPDSVVLPAEKTADRNVPSIWSKDTFKGQAPSTSSPGHNTGLGLGRPRSTLGLSPSDEQENGNGKRNLTWTPAAVEPGLVKRRSMLWDVQGGPVSAAGPTSGSGIPALKHKRSVSAIVSLGAGRSGSVSGIVGGSVGGTGKADISNAKVDKEKDKAQSKMISTGMSLRPRGPKQPPITTTNASNAGAGLAVSKRQSQIQVSKRSSTPVALIPMSTGTSTGTETTKKDVASGNRLSKRASQMNMLPPAKIAIARTVKADRPASEAARRSVRLGNSKEPSTSTTATTEDEAQSLSVSMAGSVKLRTTKRRSMMPLGFVETSGSQEILASGSDELSKSGVEGVETNRQDALDKLMGKASEVGGKRNSLTASTASVRGKTGVPTANTTPRAISKLPTPQPATRRVASVATTPGGSKNLGPTTGKANRMGGDRPPVTMLTKPDGPTKEKDTLTRSRGIKVEDAGKIPKLTMTPDAADRRSPIRATTAMGTVTPERDPLDTTSIGTEDVTTPASSICQTPRSKMLLSPARAAVPSGSSRMSLSPSNKDPLTRLRGTPASQGGEARSRTLSNNSDIDVRLEQTRRTWLGGLGRRDLGGEGDSPLTGRMSDSKLDESPRSSRVRRVASRASSSGIGGGKTGDVFGTDKGTSAKIVALEAQVKAMQEQLERERAEHEKQSEQARERQAVKEMLVAVVRACENELELLERRRAEKERMVDAFDRAVSVAVSGL
jgi:hypothetical protein